ncbi:tyrosine-type recombinase/integrase [Variovorax humicola]|uniref:Tyrosine-type recombinase/integrase n=1 Tax=Variovorax humicola TaxID=1769758 RepID=A0ABU8VV22_9BURK
MQHDNRQRQHAKQHGVYGRFVGATGQPLIGCAEPQCPRRKIAPDRQHGVRKLRHQQNKAGVWLKIALPDKLVKMIDVAIGRVKKVTRLQQHLMHRLDGKPYTYDGLASMLRRSIEATNESRKARGREPMESFGFRDLKGKGATDMWKSGVPIEQIQLLLGHKSKNTTEIYIKQRWRETAQPNMVDVA